MDKYAVKVQALIPTEELPEGAVPKMGTFNLVLEAVSYTDAEAKAWAFFEKQLKDRKYTQFMVDTIKPEKLQHVIDAMHLVDSEEAEENEWVASVFKAKVEINYHTEPNKWKKVNVLVRAYSIEDATTSATDYVADEWKADVIKCTNISESAYSALSPIFDNDDEDTEAVDE